MTGVCTRPSASCWAAGGEFGDAFGGEARPAPGVGLPGGGRRPGRRVGQGRQQERPAGAFFVTVEGASVRRRPGAEGSPPRPGRKTPGASAKRAMPARRAGDSRLGGSPDGRREADARDGERLGHRSPAHTRAPSSRSTRPWTSKAARQVSSTVRASAGVDGQRVEHGHGVLGPGTGQERDSDVDLGEGDTPGPGGAPLDHDPLTAHQVGHRPRARAGPTGRTARRSRPGAAAPGGGATSRRRSRRTPGAAPTRARRVRTRPGGGWPPGPASRSSGRSIAGSQAPSVGRRERRARKPMPTGFSGASPSSAGSSGEPSRPPNACSHISSARSKGSGPTTEARPNGRPATGGGRRRPPAGRRRPGRRRGPRTGRGPRGRRRPRRGRRAGSPVPGLGGTRSVSRSRLEAPGLAAVDGHRSDGRLLVREPERAFLRERARSPWPRRRRSRRPGRRWCRRPGRRAASGSGRTSGARPASDGPS